MQAHSETAEVRGRLSDQERLVAELRRAAATTAATAERVPTLEAELATQQQIGERPPPCTHAPPVWDHAHGHFTLASQE